MKHGHLVATWRAYPVIIYQWHQSIQLRPEKLRLYMSIWPVPKRMAHFKPSGGCSRRMDRVLEVMSWPSYPLTTFIYRSGYLLISVFVLVIGRYDLVYSTSGWRGYLSPNSAAGANANEQQEWGDGNYQTNIWGNWTWWNINNSF